MLINPSDEFRRSDICVPTDRRLAGNVVLRRIMSSYIETLDTGRPISDCETDYRAVYRSLVREVDLWRTIEQEGINGTPRDADCT